MRAKSVVRTVVTLVLVVVSVAARAERICVQQDYSLFGHLANEGDNCVPTATINSFRYLENRYPALYKDKDGNNLLTGDDLDAARDTLAAAMNPAGTGTTAKPWWEEKIDYIESRVPGKTVYKGMLDEEVSPGFDASTWTRGDKITYEAPSFDWLFEELQHGEDVELGIYWGDTGGHALTLTGLCFEDREDGSIFDNGHWDTDDVALESAWVTYLDPNAPGSTIEAELSYNEMTGRLEFTWDNKSNDDEYVWIGLAYSESPVPLPPTVMMLVVGLAGVGGYRLRRKGR